MAHFCKLGTGNIVERVEVVSNNIATVLPVLTIASLKRSHTPVCPATSPCEKLKRAIFIPASISKQRFSTDQHAGPNVQTT